MTENTKIAREEKEKSDIILLTNLLLDIEDILNKTDIKYNSPFFGYINIIKIALSSILSEDEILTNEIRYKRNPPQTQMNVGLSSWHYGQGIP